MNMESTSTFDQLLNAFWLRPETAMWREIDIRAMDNFEFCSPSIDLGCGDGLFSFIRAGGCFGDSFDAFQAMGDLDRFFDNADVFDAYDESLSPAITQRPAYQIDMGFDHKENLLKKSSTLGLYRELKMGDANHRLPFDDESFNSLFSNIVYWLDDPRSVISEIARVLRPGGKACLMLPNQTLPEFSFYNQLHIKTGDPRWSFLEKLDRGRFSDNIQQARSAKEWEEMFSSAGLRVNTHVHHLSKTAIQIWDIGLRPLFPVLQKMTGSIESDVLSGVKSQWIATFRQFLTPIVEMDAELGQHGNHAFHCYILEK